MGFKAKESDTVCKVYTEAVLDASNENSREAVPDSFSMIQLKENFLNSLRGNEFAYIPRIIIAS